MGKYFVTGLNAFKRNDISTYRRFLSVFNCTVRGAVLPTDILSAKNAKNVAS